MSRRYFTLEELRREMSDARTRPASFERAQAFRVDRLADLVGRLPRENEIFFIETRRSFTAFTFVVYLMKHAGRVNHLHIATYSTNERVVNALLRWKAKGLIGGIHLHVSETLRYRMPGIYARLAALAAGGEITLSTAWTHKKVACADTSSGHFVVEGSGNYGENAMEEQYVFLRNKEIYEFRSGKGG
ncbi:MAG: hypothetical protein LBN29_11415 [Mediterranea sp.]|jgi:hypothetical protein|nr:hypothetical protein [Mediterranea sp.]